MPCWDYQGRCIGVTKRKVENKWFYIPEGVTKPIYLLNYAIKESWRDIYLCESQINALYMNSLGYHACACFGTGSEHQAKDISKYGIRSVVFCFDGDSAGRIGRERMRKNISRNVLCSYIELPDGKDMNDLSPEEVHKIIQNPIIF
jgi:DNA primase